MPTLRIAHIREQGQDMIIAPLDSSFDLKPDDEKHAAINEIQMAATSAGLVGTVVPVWMHGRQMAFIAPQPWHPFFQSLTMQQVLRSINRDLSW